MNLGEECNVLVEKKGLGIILWKPGRRSIESFFGGSEVCAIISPFFPYALPGGKLWCDHSEKSGCNCKCAAAAAVAVAALQVATRSKHFWLMEKEILLCQQCVQGEPGNYLG